MLSRINKPLAVVEKNTGQHVRWILPWPEVTVLNTKNSFFIKEIHWFIMKSLPGIRSFSFNSVNDLIILFDPGGSWSCLQGVWKNALEVIDSLCFSSQPWTCLKDVCKNAPHIGINKTGGMHTVQLISKFGLHWNKSSNENC